MNDRVIDRINNRMNPVIVVDDPIYEALFGKQVYTENSPIDTSSDYNCGAIANELELLRRFINFVISCFSIEDAEDTFLEQIIQVFVDFERIYDETDANLLNRFKAYMHRNNNPRWQTKWSYKDIFSYFFDSADIYVEENYIEDNVIANYDFENSTGDDFDDWIETVAGSSTITADTDPFQNQQCAKFNIDSSNNSASISQTLSAIAAGNYKLSFWYLDDANCPADTPLKISIQRSGDSYYYNFDDGTWQAAAAYKTFEKATDWTLAYAFVENVDTRDLIIKIENDGASGTAYAFTVDRVMFGTWQDYPSIKLMIVFEAADLNPSFFAFAWDGSDDDNLIDRGECEDTTVPAFKDETSNTLTNATFARDSAEAFFADYSYKHTKVAAGDSDVVLGDNDLTTDLHGLVANTKYTVMFRLFIPDVVGCDYDEFYVNFRYYSGGSWTDAIQYAVNIKDQWQTVYVTVTLAAGATAANIQFTIESSAGNSEYVYIDDIRLFEGDPSDIQYASFIDIDYIYGIGAGYTSDLFIDLLQKAKAAGVKSDVEYILRVVP